MTYNCGGKIDLSDSKLLSASSLASFPALPLLTKIKLEGIGRSGITYHVSNLTLLAGVGVTSMMST